MHLIELSREPTKIFSAVSLKLTAVNGTPNYNSKVGSFYLISKILRVPSSLAVEQISGPLLAG